MKPLHRSRQLHSANGRWVSVGRDGDSPRAGWSVDRNTLGGRFSATVQTVLEHTGPPAQFLFYVLLTVHLSIILVINQLNA